MSDPARDMVTAARGVLREWPKWAQVVLFLAIAVVAALAGKLDDWVRIVLAILFVALALTLVADIVAKRDAS